MNTVWPSGFVTALITPMDHDGAVVLEEVAALVNTQVEAGVAGVVVGGGTGEFGALTLDERRTLLETVLDVSDGRVPVIAQTGALSTRDAVALTEHANVAGASGVLVASPFGEPINWRERRAFYATVSAAGSLPLMVYNTPPAGVLDLDQIKELADLEGVSAVKDSSGDFPHFADLAAWGAETGFGVYVGIDSLLLEGLLAGAAGAVFGSGNVLAPELVELCDAVLGSGISHEEVARWRLLRPVLREFERSACYVGSCKGVLNELGLKGGGVRAPYLMPSEEHIRHLTGRIADLRSVR